MGKGGLLQWESISETEKAFSGQVNYFGLHQGRKEIVAYYVSLACETAFLLQKFTGVLMSRKKHGNEFDIILGQAIVMLLDKGVVITYSSLLRKLKTLLETAKELRKMEAIREVIAKMTAEENYKKASEQGRS